MVSSSNAINNTVGASISGVTNTLTVTNPSNTASSAARETITVGGGTAGDPTINWNVSGVTNFEMGLDNSDSDKLKISQGTALGTNDTWIMDTAGRRLMPLQPAFSVAKSLISTNVTGDGTNYTIVYDTVEFDQGGNFSAGTTFTAPITGKYFLLCNVTPSNLSVAHTRAFLTIGVVGAIQWNAHNQADNLNFGSGYFGRFVNLTAGTAVTTVIAVYNGTKTVSIGGATYDSYFSGWLVC